MNAPDVAALVERIVSTWPTGPRGFVWTDALGKLDDYDRARLVYEQLTISDERPPSVARFVAQYRAAERRADVPPRPLDAEVISLADYLARHDDAALRQIRERHPSKGAEL